MCSRQAWNTCITTSDLINIKYIWRHFRSERVKVTHCHFFLVNLRTSCQRQTTHVTVIDSSVVFLFFASLGTIHGNYPGFNAGNYFNFTLYGCKLLSSNIQYQWKSSQLLSERPGDNLESAWINNKGRKILVSYSGSKEVSRCCTPSWIAHRQ